jgi:hypothetical protein
VRAALLFAVILLGALDPRPLLRIPRYAASDRKVPLYPLFLKEVAARTAPGQSIAIAAPMRHWNAGYSYAYYRASYFLAGRRVIPLVGPDDRLHMERLREAELLAMWRLSKPNGPYELVWSGHGGALYRRLP